jgi:hypothetical protein
MSLGRTGVDQECIFIVDALEDICITYEPSKMQRLIHYENGVYMFARDGLA